MKTFVIALACLLFGAFGVYLIMRPQTNKKPTESIKPQTKTNSINNEKIYTEDEVKAKIEFERKRNKLESNWRELIICEKSGGKWGGALAGGFQDVTIRIKNNSDYMIDNLVVGVFLYRGLNADIQCYYEPILFENVPPNAEKSKKFTYTKCGQRLDAIIQALNIESLELHVNTGIDD